MSKTKTIYVDQAKHLNLDQFPNFHGSLSTAKMKDKKHYGKDALLVRCGLFVYNVTEKPEIYYETAH